MSTATKRPDLDEQLVELAREVAPGPEREDELELECPWCGAPVDESGYCSFEGATVLGGLEPPR